MLRLVRTGSDVQALVSINGGAFQTVGGPGFFFTGFATPGDPQGNGSNTQEGGFKVGVYAVGGGASPASIAFDSLSATSTVPEPASIGVVLLAGGLGLRRRNRRA